MLLLILLVLVTQGVAKHHRHRVPQIDTHGEEELVGFIREDEAILNIPDLGIIPDSGPVCSYILTSKDGPVPFEVDVLDRYTGSAIIKLQAGKTLDCKTSEYDLKIVAVKCEDEHTQSEPVKLRINIKDTNNHEPEFEHPWYTVTVDEGKIHNEIIRVQATDADCGHPYGEICEYEITNGLEKFPFVINSQGVVSNTQPLNASATKSYILTVVAHDCGMRKSKSALITVNVKAACVDGITGLPDRFSYHKQSGALKLLPNAKLSLCSEDAKCTVSTIRSTVELHSGHVSKCSHGIVYDNQTTADCGLSTSAVSLLDEETKFEGTNENGRRFLFDGLNNAYIVPFDKVDGLIPDTFTLSFSMKHANGSHEEQNTKQNILCESDNTAMNRHHFSVYVRRCKLEVVLRRESGALQEFRAAEWRWNTAEVCDNTWHSYSLIFNGVDDVHLMIDGTMFRQDERNPEILDDWPLHKTTPLKTRLVVGACWHGRTAELAQYFKGSLSSMYIVKGKAESPKALTCARQCPERLETGDEEKSDKNTESTSITLSAKTPEDLTKKLQTITYINSLENPAPGHRQVKITTTAECTEGKTMTIPEFKGYLFVKEQAEPILSISGTSSISADQKALKVGTTMLPEFRITVTQPDEDGSMSDVTAGSSLDYCKVHLKPSRDVDQEYFSSPATLIATTKIDFEHDKQGLVLRGEDTVAAYKEVLAKIHYFNTRPDAYSKRIYAVQCSMHKGKVISNDFIVTMSIEPSAESTAAPAPAAAPKESDVSSSEELVKHYEPSFDQLGGSRLQNILEMDLPRPKALLSHHGYDMGQGAVAGGAVAIVVVVCVGFLLVLLVVGVLKMRDTPMPKRRRGKKNQEGGMEWDDSGMNITVNPLDDVEKLGAVYSEDDETSDEDSYHEGEEMSEEEDEEEAEVLPHLHNRQPLEWDDEQELASPLAARPPSVRSYRV